LAVCFCPSCERDEDGHILHYFNIEEHGYVFYRLPDGTLVPCSNQDVIIENFISSSYSFWMEYDAYYDHVTTDKNGSLPAYDGYYYRSTECIRSAVMTARN
jgi:hypothetical protein